MQCFKCMCIKYVFKTHIWILYVVFEIYCNLYFHLKYIVTVFYILQDIKYLIRTRVWAGYMTWKLGFLGTFPWARVLKIDRSVSEPYDVDTENCLQMCLQLFEWFCWAADYLRAVRYDWTISELLSMFLLYAWRHYLLSESSNRPIFQLKCFAKSSLALFEKVEKVTIA